MYASEPEVIPLIRSKTVQQARKYFEEEFACQKFAILMLQEWRRRQSAQKWLEASRS